jgi:hypothetical protein
MAKRSFLIPVAAAIAALTQPVQPAVANSGNTDATVDKNSQFTLSNEEAIRLSLPNAGEEKNVLVPSGGDLFQFTLRRAVDGLLIAQHRSHYSHESHSSHSSHRSHYSSRY